MKTPQPALVLGLSLMVPALFGGRCGAAETRVFTNEAGGYEITLPADWQQVPDEPIQQLVKRLSAVMPIIAKEPYRYGYQRGYTGHWFTSPYLLVQVGEQGPVREEEFAKAADKGGAIEAGMKKAADQAKIILKGADTTTPIYDYQRHMLRLGIHEQLANGAEITGVSGIFLTSRGTLAFHFYARKEEFDGFKGDFDSAIDSVKLSSDLAYKPPPSPFARYYRTLIFAAVGACIGVIVAIVRRRSARTPPPLPPSYTA